MTSSFLANFCQGKQTWSAKLKYSHLHPGKLSNYPPWLAHKNAYSTITLHIYCRTRMLFVRLLALVKWASSASKVDVCTGIQQFLDQQSGLLTDTANRLAGMARETLVRATLPNFHLPAAVEVLTTGSYSRVPRIIRDRIVPPETITTVEKRQVLLRLNQVIEHR